MRLKWPRARGWRWGANGATRRNTEPSEGPSQGHEPRFLSKTWLTYGPCRPEGPLEQESLGGCALSGREPEVGGRVPTRQRGGAPQSHKALGGTLARARAA
eukprot:820286-Pyramimonas_sp.AAC.1